MLKKEIRGSKESLDPYIRKWGANHDKMKELRKKASQLVSKSNKRIRRLEKNGYSDLPSLKSLKDESTGGLKQFSIKGQTYQELQQTIAKMKKFDEMKTSTMKGIKDWLLGVKKATTGKDYLDPKEKKKSTKKLYDEGKRFFNVYNRVIEYGENIQNGVPPYVYYKEIFKEINKQVETSNKSLAEMSDDELTELESNLASFVDSWNQEEKIDDEVDRQITKDGDYNFLI